MKVLGADVARVMRSAAARGDEADFVRARKGARALVALICSIVLRARVVAIWRSGMSICCLFQSPSVLGTFSKLDTCQVLPIFWKGGIAG